MGLFWHPVLPNPALTGKSKPLKNPMLAIPVENGE